MTLAFYISIAIAVGLAGGLQGLVNSNLNKSADLPLTTLVVNMVAAVAVLVIYMVFSRQSFAVLKDANWWAFTGGFLGIVVVMGSTFLVPRLGITITSSIIIVSQLCFAMVADHYGFLGIKQIPIDTMRLGAVGLMIAGIYLFFK